MMITICSLLLWCFVVNSKVSCEAKGTLDHASLLQRGEVHRVTANVGKYMADMEPVLRRIRLTTPNIQTLKYPTDAEARSAWWWFVLMVVGSN